MTIYLLQADIDMRNLARWSAAEGHSDPDRSLHSLVYHTFGKDKVPRAFAAMPHEANPKEHARFLAYTGMDAPALQELARSNQSIITAGIMNPFTFRTTSLPQTWQKGTTLAFQVRLIPTYRATRSGSEQDVHHRDDAAPTRQESYCNWLARLMRRKAGAEPAEHTLHVTRYASRRVKRSEGQQWIVLPDVTIEGVCTITNSQTWNNALQLGIGRHKAYGYGMLLLRPVRA